MQPAQPEFIDAEMGFHANKDELNFRFIALSHLRKIMDVGSVEFRGGYWQQSQKQNKEGTISTSKTYVPDSREEFCNSILMLHDILLPHFDDEMNKASKEINDKIETLRLATIKATSVNEGEILGTDEEDTMILSADSYTGKDRMVIEAFRYGKLRKVRQLFQEISKFLFRKDYFGAAELME